MDFCARGKQDWMTALERVVYPWPHICTYCNDRWLIAPIIHLCLPIANCDEKISLKMKEKCDNLGNKKKKKGFLPLNEFGPAKQSSDQKSCTNVGENCLKILTKMIEFHHKSLTEPTKFNLITKMVEIYVKISIKTKIIDSIIWNVIGGTRKKNSKSISLTWSYI